MFLEGGRKPENPEETPRGTGKNMHRRSTQTAKGFKKYLAEYKLQLGKGEEAWQAIRS